LDVLTTPWLSPETEKTRAKVEVAPQREAPPEETTLEKKLRESIELAKQGKLGELGNGMFAVQAGASAGTPAPVQADALNGHHATNNGKTVAAGANQRPGGRLRRGLEHCEFEAGDQVKPEDVRTLVVTAYIQCSKGGLYAG
jgi:hypothetical protein